MGKYNIAQVNIARGKAEMDDAIMSGFVSRLDEINEIADNSPGFIWRLQSDDGNATSIEIFDDHMLLVNMSVWENIESLKDFVYKTSHVELIQDREAWFNKMEAAHQTLWWVPNGHFPTVLEAQEKLEHIRRHGPSQNAFTFSNTFVHP